MLDWEATGIRHMPLTLAALRAIRFCKVDPVIATLRSMDTKKNFRSLYEQHSVPDECVRILSRLQRVL